ncbi:hypothetical protein [Hydrogenophaga palleronii]|uniref:hypothetical protein n=1 Tax=Hydrogenophaga palleronii TaxID=65655 RepID=UPI000826F68F|nr:hypothetical protein [Hydrogenophaga palleronii]
MKPSDATGAGPTPHAAPTHSIPELVAEVYEAAPPAERSRLLEQLLRPLGLLSLFGIAGGVFGQLRFRHGWHEQIRVDELPAVDSGQLVALVEHAQQVSVETVDGLAQLLTASPVLSGSAAATLLVALLVQRAQQRRAMRRGRG